MKTRLATLGLALALVSSIAVAQAQPAAPVPPAKVEEVKLEPVVEAWMKVLAAKIADANELIKNSSQQGLVTLGKPALPFLKTLAEGTDATVAAESKKVIARIERAGNRPANGRAGRQNADGTAASPAGNSVENVIKELGLNAEQDAKVKAMQEKNREKSREIFSQVQDGSLTREEARAATEELRGELNKQLKGVLSEEQFKKYEEATRNAGRGAGGQRRRGGGG